MGFKKYARKQVRRAGKYLKKRYVPNGRIDMDRIAKDLTIVKSVLNTERKHSDATMATNVTVQGIDSAPHWNLYMPLNISQGDATIQRNGSSVRFKSIQIKGDIEIGSTAPSQRCKMVVFIDKEPLTSGVAGTDVSFNQLYQDLSFDSMRNWDSILQKRFKVIYTKQVMLHSDRPNHSINMYKKLNMKTKWLSTGTVGDLIQDNCLYVAFISSEAQVQTARPVINLRTRVTFVDN